MKKLLMLIACVAMSFNAAAAMVVIGNPAGVASLSKNDVKKVFLGKKTSLNGNKVALVELAQGNANRAAFHQQAVGRSEAQIQSAWSRLVFTGKADAPTEVADSAAAVAKVAATPNAIGYADESAVDGSVKVLFKF